MGNWNINIQGVGSYGNGLHGVDADMLAREFVYRLQGLGHTVESATFNHGGKDDLLKKIAEVATSKVRINGKVEYIEGAATYDKVVSLAGYEPARILSVTYSKAFRGESGILSQGQYVLPTDGTVFSVADTSNA